MCVGVLGGCAGPRATFPLERSEREVEASEVPPAARARLEALAGGRPLESFEREDRGAFVAYEGEWEEGGVEHEATVLADGAVVERARELSESEMEDLPPEVRARVRALQARGYEVEVDVREAVFYEIEAERETDDGEEEEIEALVRPDGADVNRGGSSE